MSDHEIMDAATAAEHNHTHEHHHSHDHEHSHGHSHAHSHTHTHSPEHTRAVINRMNRAIGHMEAVRTMVEDGRDCSEVLIQIAAVRSAINNIGKLILKEHISHCVVDAVETGDEQCLTDLEDAINKFIK
ncbi:MAG: CsoR family transcriptional regulator [Pseudobutyrivibrio sp.]|nr:CsoR family transcriptional regulator [Pseudobutyrivibrio sp.]